MTLDTSNIPAETVPVLYRRADADDAAFVFSYWLRDYFERSRFAKGISKGVFMHLHHLVLERVIARSIVHVACDPEAPGVVYGFICAEGSTLHYVYVKRRFRRQGVARGLLKTAHLDDGGLKLFTHLTDEGVGLRKRFPLAEYSPYHL